MIGARFKPYPEYKDSGIEWLGVIPAHWEIQRLRHSATLNPSKREIAAEPKGSEVAFLPMTKVSETGELTLDETRQIGEVFEGYTYFRDNDVLLAKITPCFENGKAAVAKNLVSGRGFGSTEFHVLRPRGTTDSCFLYYVVFSDPFRRIGTTHMIGAAGQKRVPEQFVLDWVQPFPELSEQKFIADFLDRETAKIDALVKKKERLIELLQEKRTALITHAVTKGLDPNVPMRDSGIEWLGQIPAHWEVKRLCFLGKAIIGLTFSPADIADQDSGTLVLRASNVSNKRIILKDTVFVSCAIPERLITRAGDILICSRSGSRALIGKCAMIHEESAGLTFGVFMTIFRSPNNIYLFYVFNSRLFAYQSSAFLTSTINQLTIANLNNFKVPLPLPREQQDIADFLDREMAKIDALIAKIEKAIKLLKEYRTALISAAVTGKIDIRDEAISVAVHDA
jgi:type I restriction enzyme S subunit